MRKRSAKLGASGELDAATVAESVTDDDPVFVQIIFFIWFGKRRVVRRHHAYRARVCSPPQRLHEENEK